MSCKNHVDILGCNNDNECVWFENECKERRKSRRLATTVKKSYNEQDFDDDSHKDKSYKEVSYNFEQKAVKSARKKRLTSNVIKNEQKEDETRKQKQQDEQKQLQKKQQEEQKQLEKKQQEEQRQLEKKQQEENEQQGWGSWLYNLAFGNKSQKDEEFEQVEIIEHDDEYADYDDNDQIVQPKVVEAKKVQEVKKVQEKEQKSIDMGIYEKKVDKKPDWALKILNMKKIKNWNLQTNNVFSTADVTLVLPAKGPNNEDVIFKASSDIGMILNEGNYMGEIRSRAKKYGMKHIGIPTILDKGMVTIDVNGESKKIGYYVTNNVGISLESIANAIGFGKNQFVGVPEFIGFKVPKVASIAQHLLKVLKVMHVPENSLGLLHNDIKPGNVLYNRNDNQIYLIDFDTTGAISSVISKTGKTKGVPGSYEFTGTDCLSKKSPGPKCDLDALGQFLIWCSVGKLPWKTTRKNMDALAEEKAQWRKLPFTKRPGLGPLVNSKSFIDYFTYIDTLENYTPANEIDYDYLYNCFNDIAENPLKL